MLSLHSALAPNLAGESDSRNLETVGPLTVESGHVDCDHGALVFRYNGTTYALNMTARGQGHPGSEPIWKTAASAGDHRPLKVNLTPLIELAREQCK